MATITVSFVDNVLKMSDKGNTKAKNNEHIHWQPRDGVKSVTNVTAKPSSSIPTANFWSNPPHQNGANFKGTINGTVEGDWDYEISCNVGTIESPVILTIDPRIQVLPR